jgi:hypothetical protein
MTGNVGDVTPFVGPGLMRVGVRGDAAAPLETLVAPLWSGRWLS